MNSQTSAKRQRKTAKPESRLLAKKDQLIRMLNRTSGADVASISDRLGWQHHTTRAALTGLRKAGYEIAAEKPDRGKPTRYRIVAVPEKAAGKPKPRVPGHAG